MADNVDFSKFMSMDPDKQKAMGMQALMSGKVTPDEVQQAQTLMAHPAFQSAIQGGAQAPAAPNAFAQAVTGQAPPPSTQKKQTTADSKNATTTKTGGTKNLYASKEDFAGRMKSVEDLPEVADERASIEKAQNRLNMQAQQMPDNDGAWIRPFAAYVDSTQGTKLSPAANAMPTNADRQAGINTAQDALMKRKTELAKLIFEGGKQLKEGTQTNQVSDLQQQINRLVEGDQMGGNGLSQVRGQQLIKAVGKDYDDDKVLVHLVNVNNSLDRAKTMVTKPALLTSKNLNAAYMDYINSLSNANAATEGKVSREIPESLVQTVNEIANYAHPNEDIRATSEGKLLVKNFLEQIAQVQGDYKRQGLVRAEQKRSSYGQMSYPGVKETVDAKMDWWTHKFGAEEAPPAKAPAKGSDKYPAGEPNNKWTAEQLKAFLADHP